MAPAKAIGGPVFQERYPYLANSVIPVPAGPILM